MHRIIIDGNNELSGKVKISGSKNSAVALVPAAVLCDEEVSIANVPNISDILSNTSYTSLFLVKSLANVVE